MKMYNRPGQLLVMTLLNAAFLGSMLGSFGAHAAQQFWVSLGSYSQLSGAQDMRNRAQVTFSQLSVVPSESNIGFVYRVLDGPVFSRAEADEKLERARFAGFVDAWLVVKDESFAMPAGLSEAELTSGEANQYGVSSSSRSSYDSGSEYGVQDSTQSVITNSYSNGDVRSVTEDYTTPKVGEQELVETAPAGYGLHQLRRSGPASGAGGADSRLRELDVLARPKADSEE